MSRTRLNTGRALMSLSNLTYALGAFYFDWNETHIYNPLWPGHALFHNGQTMSLSVLLALTSIYFLFLAGRHQSSLTERRSALCTAAWVGCLYTSAGLSAILYPGATWSDPPQEDGGPQLVLFSGLIVMQGVGLVVAWPSAEGEGGVKGKRKVG